MDSIYPREALSYSSIDLWYKNKREYRNKYYLNKKPIDTMYTVFGKEIHECIGKDKDKRFKELPILAFKEYDIRVIVDGIPLRGYIDTFDFESKTFYEYKTGIPKEDGSPRWTLKEVYAHKQLPFYALLIKEKYGYYNPETKLISLETGWKKEKEEIGKSVLTISQKLYLTGNFQVFDRRIENKELDIIKNWIVEGARQIKEDYKRWIEIEYPRNTRGL